jgi:hypothetical protein
MRTFPISIIDTRMGERARRVGEVAEGDIHHRDTENTEEDPEWDGFGVWGLGPLQAESWSWRAPVPWRRHCNPIELCQDWLN